MDNFDRNLDRYAELLVRHGLNVQKGQDVYIGTEPIHRDFVTKIVKAAYQAGARVVSVDMQDPRNARTRILETQTDDYLNYVVPAVPFRFESMIPETAATLRLIGSEYPEILADLDPKKVNQVEFNYKKSLKKFYEEGIGHSKVQWTVAAAATPAWGKRVFPELNEKAAYEALWKEIFKICRVDQSNYLELWKTHNGLLEQRAKKLTEMQIKYLHFTGPGTDLKVGLSTHAKFLGGCSISARKVSFEANIPTEECFTTPDYHMTEGKAKVTRPFLINGTQVRGLNLEFKNGEITNFNADEGAESFSECIKADRGAKFLGEVALVGTDSPIYQSGRVFEEILFDENAACHIAIGFAYRFCVDGSEKMSPEDLEKVGCNTSSVHTDMMISSDQVDVIAECYSGKSIPLIQKGKWAQF
jgi:aminopeptidase